ncbi:unnamed protein product [Allacma fusca]|uniref:Uncharacterized protein n=1 Tax=Allacma fusca TaxID=39272 RepID=A0A8J2JJM1_9HEXA|nr:unnamed protein product [Allacma fusca]
MEQKITGFFFPTAIAALGINHVISYNNWGTLHVLFNQSTLVCTNIKDSSKRLHSNCLFQNEDAAHVTKLFKVVTNVALFALITSCVFRAGKVMIKPESGELISSMLRYVRPGERIAIWLRVPFAILQFNLTCFHGYGICLHGIISVVNGVNVSGALSAIRIPMQKSEEYQNISALEMLSRSYYKLQVLQCVFNHAFSSWPLMFELCTVVIVTVRLFLAIVNKDIGKFVSGISLLFALLRAFKAYAQVHEDGVRTIKSWVTISQPWFRRYRKSVWPIQTNVGTFFYIDSTLILTIISIIITSTTNLLISCRNYF